MEEDENDKDNKYTTFQDNLDKIDTMATNVIKNTFANGIFENKRIKQLFNQVKKAIKNVPLIDKNTIVYQLPLTGETKYKNYDKIVTDIRRVEINIRKENEIKRKKKIEQKEIDYENQNNDYLYSDNYEEEKEEEKIKKNIFNTEEYNILEVIQKFKILPEKRTIEDLYILKNYLYQTKLIENYLNEFNNDKKIIENLVTFYGLEFKYKKFQKGETIFKIGDMADNFYSILLGKVDLLKVLPKEVEMSGFEYFCYIMELIKKKEIYRLKLCINTNKKIFPINIEDETILPFIYLHFILKDIYDGKKIDDFNKILEIINISPTQIGIGANKIITNDYINDNYKKIKKKFPKIPDDKIRDYIFINNKIIKKHIKTFDYDKFMTFEALDFFGENSIENNTSRNGTMICAEDTEVLYLNNKLYLNYVLAKKAIIQERKTAFLNKNYLFNKIPQKKFEKKYFSWFILEHYNKGDILFNENDKLEYVYFIKEGSCRLLTSKSILELEIFINEINKKIKVIQNIFNNNEFINENDISTFNYNNTKSDCHELLEHINKREKIKLFILKESEDIGIESYLLGLNNLTTCIVDSISAKIYKIDIKYLTEIFTNEKICFYELIDRVEKKLKVYCERLYEINNIKLSITDKKITEKKNDIYQNEFNNNSNITSFSPKNKVDLYYDKLKQIINYNNNNSISNYNNLKSNNLSLTLPNLSIKANHNIRNIYNNYLNLSKYKNIKNRKIGNLKNSFFNKKQSDNKNNSKLNTNYTTKTAFSFGKKMTTKNILTENSIEINKKRKEFPYIDKVYKILKKDFNNLLNEKLKLIRPKQNKFLNKETSIKSLSQENIYNNINTNISLNRNNNTISNTQNNENNNTTDSYNKHLLLTQLDNFNNKFKPNKKFLLTEYSFKVKKNHSKSKKILNYNKTYSTDNKIKNLNKKNSSKIIINNDIIRQSSLKNNLKIINPDNYVNKNSGNIFGSKTSKTNRIIGHPYISPLTLIKIKKYKMITEKDKFLEDKKRYEINQKLKYKSRGLNPFGYPIAYNKRLIRKYFNIKTNKEK